MSKQDLLEFKGKVTDLLPNAMFRVQLDNGQKLSKGTYIDAEVLDAIGKSGVEDVYVLTPFNSLNPE